MTEKDQRILDWMDSRGMLVEDCNIRILVGGLPGIKSKSVSAGTLLDAVLIGLDDMRLLVDRMIEEAKAL
jgi:hypothetical protein